MKNTDTQAPCSALYKALSNAQSQFPVITKDSKAHSYTYGSLPMILKAVVPVLKDNGLSFTQLIDFEGDKTFMITRLMHESGQSIESRMPIALQMSLSNDMRNNLCQKSGSLITYARRYSLCAILGIMADDDDDGASTVSQQKQQQTKGW